MIIIRKKWFYSFIIALCVIAAAMLYWWPSREIPTLKCKAFGKINMDIEQEQLFFSIVESLQFYDKNKGIIQYEGDVKTAKGGNDSNLLIVFYVQIMPDDLVMQLHRF